MLHRSAVLTLCLTALAFHQQAQAATLQTMLTGTGLSLDSPCMRRVDIQPDASLHGQAVVQATAENQQELDQLVLESRRTATIRNRPGECWHPTPIFQPTLDVSVRVPAGFPLDIDASGVTRYAIGPVGGPMKVSLSGASELEAAEVSTLDAQLSGSGRISVQQASGPARLDMSGHGRIEVGRADMPSLAVSLSGAGELRIDAGQVGSLTLDQSGAGHVQFGATVGDAKVDLSGVGAVHFVRVTGRLDKDVSGVGTVTVGD